MDEHAPLVFMWIAFYDDGMVLPQFDLENGKENYFANIDQKKLTKFCLYPIKPDLAAKINEKAGAKIVKFKEGLPYFPMKILPDQRLIYVRRNYIRIFTYQYCAKCGYRWQYMPTKPEKIGDAGLPCHPDNIFQTYGNKMYPLAKCPKCGCFNAIVCPDCGTLINEMKRVAKSAGHEHTYGASQSEEHYFECPKCKKEHPRHVKNMDGGNRSIIYLLGYQITVDGKNKKFIQYIDENGEYEISDNFNYK